MSSREIDLSWTDNAVNEEGYSVERFDNKSDLWMELAVVGADVESYVDTSVKLFERYLYRVRAFNAGGSSGYSNVKVLI